MVKCLGTFLTSCSPYRFHASVFHCLSKRTWFSTILKTVKYPVPWNFMSNENACRRSNIPIWMAMYVCKNFTYLHALYSSWNLQWWSWNTLLSHGGTCLIRLRRPYKAVCIIQTANTITILKLVPRNYLHAELSLMAWKWDTIESSYTQNVFLCADALQEGSYRNGAFRFSYIYTLTT